MLTQGRQHSSVVSHGFADPILTQVEVCDVEINGHIEKGNVLSVMIRGADMPFEYTVSE